MNPNTIKSLFKELFAAKTESEVDKVIVEYPSLSDLANWSPLDNNISNFGVIENQQSSPIAALIEKITNSIDAILMRKCFEAGLNPKSSASPMNMDEAIARFYHKDSVNWHKNWDLGEFRQKQAEEIQIHADGDKLQPSLVIYDSGEGQHPADFERTFLSLLKGNKSDIPFVQGKYNMGGTGAIVFCGKKRYHLISSKRFDGSGEFGFTLIREHPLNEKESFEVEKGTLKNTWYEYLKIDGEIPSFPIDSLDLGLRNRNFTSGTIIKLYSYSLPSGARSVISRDLNQSINEFLFQPALPIYTIDKAERYPKDRNLARDLFGLKRRLEQDNSKYIEDIFSEEVDIADIGKSKITSYIFKTKIAGKTAKESKESICREFFKNNMAVLFSLNGQVHGHYTSEFITRSLKMPLLKNHLLIHVDCTHMQYNFRKELFMASRDRLKGSNETSRLRTLLADTLGKGKLQDLYKIRKESISIDSGDTSDLLKSFTRSMPLNSDLMKLLQNTFKIDLPKENSKNGNKVKKDKSAETKIPFLPQRFPTIFNLNKSGTEEKPAAQIPLGGNRSLNFSTDVENQYFDRTEEPGDLQISLLSFKPNDQTGGTAQGTLKQLSSLINISKASPNEGKIRILMSPSQKLNAGDLLQIQASLSTPGDDLVQRFWVKIVNKEKPPQITKDVDNSSIESLGLPQYHLVYKEKIDPFISWDDFEEKVGEEMGFSTIMYPLVEGEKLDSIFINMDSKVLKSYKSRIKTITEEQIELADKKYLSSVYFHSLFLFTIAKQKRYDIYQDDKDVELAEFLKDIFSSHYSEFLLNFGTEELMATLSI